MPTPASRTVFVRSTLLALVAIALAGVAAPGASAAGKPPMPADLVPTAISTTGTGKPSHVVLRTDGSPGTLIIFVKVHNNGPGSARKSRIAVTAHFERESQVIAVANVPGLRRDSGDEIEIPIEHKFNNLGFAWLSAEANASGVVRETRRGRSNNRIYAPKRRIAFLAKFWKVGTFATVDVDPPTFTGKVETENTPTMKFRFREYSQADEAYIYDVEGGVAGYAKGVWAEICPIEGSGAAAHYPWAQPESLLRISQSLSIYHAYVWSSHDEPFPAPLFCDEKEVPGSEVNFLDLVTYESGKWFVPMKPSRSDLEGSGHDPSALVKWQFWAEIPDEPQPPPPPEYPSE